MPSSNPCHLAKQPTPTFQVQIFCRKAPDTSTRVRQVENLFSSSDNEKCNPPDMPCENAQVETFEKQTRYIPSIVGDKNNPYPRKMNTQDRTLPLEARSACIES